MNKVMLIGHVGKEPEMSYTPSGSAVTKFSLAVSRRWKDKESGEMKDETTWFNIVAWERLAETCNQYVHKGDKLFVEGRFNIRDYTDKDNIQRRIFDVIISDMEMLTPKGTGSRGDSSSTAPATSAPGELSGNDDFPF